MRGQLDRGMGGGRDQGGSWSLGGDISPGVCEGKENDTGNGPGRVEGYGRMQEPGRGRSLGGCKRLGWRGSLGVGGDSSTALGVQESGMGQESWTVKGQLAGAWEGTGVWYGTRA